MDKILSARVDDRIVQKITDLANNLRISKKAVIEKAIDLFGRKVDDEKKRDVFDETCGAWDRDENATETVSKIRQAFRKSMHRYER